MPSATTMRVWNGDQGSRSMRAGMRLRIAPGSVASGAVVMEFLRDGRGERPLPARERLTHATLPGAPAPVNWSLPYLRAT